MIMLENVLLKRVWSKLQKAIKKKKSKKILAYFSFKNLFCVWLFFDQSIFYCARQHLERCAQFQAKTLTY